ncbi:MAG: tripartite tricarboxylate transporter substrate binding protein [Paracoccaceae bacterium]|nr:tripartite tricarboxylate transporter substrate binding protein [Paracoccaceae bacterium]MDE2673532.1 tripartite tricarboxylate transporter substrate binding protein [Paracoccaceae bacterium]MYF46826.1 tripartite tricarboxylate transporter substrate binding protein [Paracoccaceae bacterium]
MNLIKFAVSSFAVLWLSMGAAMAEWPDKPITYVVSFGAGGNADIVARMNADVLSRELGVPVNVVNKPGGAHIPATMSVVEAPADGYTLFNWSPPSFMIVPLTRETPYAPLEDFIPLFAGISASNALYVRGDSPYTTFEEFLEGAKENKLTIGVNNLGAPPNLSAVQLANEFGLEFKTLALKTVPATMAGLIGGQVDVAVGQVASIHAYQDGEVRPLIILDNARQPYMEKDLPGVRTVGEAFPGKEAGVWVHGGLAVKAGTPQEIVNKLLEASKPMGEEEFISQVPKSVGYNWVHGVDETTALIQAGIDLYSPILDGLGLLQK